MRVIDDYLQESLLMQKVEAATQTIKKLLDKRRYIKEVYKSEIDRIKRNPNIFTHDLESKLNHLKDVFKKQLQEIDLNIKRIYVEKNEWILKGLRLLPGQ